jgi:hypothetical protein
VVDYYKLVLVYKSVMSSVNNSIFDDFIFRSVFLKLPAVLCGTFFLFLSERQNLVNFLYKLFASLCIIIYNRRIMDSMNIEEVVNLNSDQHNLFAYVTFITNDDYFSGAQVLIKVIIVLS